MPNRQSDLDQIFYALSDPTRRAVLRKLSLGSATVKELAGPFDMALPSFMQHLRVLETSGLIRSKKTGRVRICKMQPAAIENAESWLAEQRHIWERRLDQFDEYVTQLKTKENTK